jgi:hypothetical protein
MYNFVVVAPCNIFLPSGNRRLSAGDVLPLDKPDAQVVLADSFKYKNYLRLVSVEEANSESSTPEVQKLEEPKTSQKLEEDSQAPKLEEPSTSQKLEDTSSKEDDVSSKSELKPPRRRSNTTSESDTQSE